MTQQQDQRGDVDVADDIDVGRAVAAEWRYGSWRLAPSASRPSRPVRTLDALAALLEPGETLSIVLPRLVQAELDAGRLQGAAGRREAAAAHLGVAARLLRSKRMSTDDIGTCLGLTPAEVRRHLPRV